MKFSPLITSAVLALTSYSAFAGEVPFYVGTYTKKEGSKGIYQYKLNTDTGAVSGGGLAAEASNPTFLALHPNRKFLYAAMENSGGAVGGFEIQADGSLKPLNQQSTKGGGACHVWVDASGKYALAANYGGGSISAMPIKPDGSLGEATGFVQHAGSSVNPARQKGPHAHSIYTHGNEPFVYVCDLGLDKVLIYKLDPAAGSLSANTPAAATIAPGSGPRHLAFHPTLPYAYVINEMLNTVTVLKHDAKAGSLESTQTISTLPPDFKGESSTAEIFVHPNGRFVYGSNRGHDSIVVYAVDQTSGGLKLIEHVSTQGKGPRNFALDPEGRFLLAANQQTNNVFVFRIDPDSGKLTPTGNSFELGSPVAIQFVPSGK